MGSQRPDGDAGKAEEEIEVFKRKWICEWLSLLTKRRY
jgi:hypothetical protein